MLSKLPLEAVTSWQHARHPSDAIEPVFSRDLLEVEVLSPDGRRRLVTVYNNHLKSKFVPFNQNPAATSAASDLRRTRQAEVVAAIVAARQRPNGQFVIVGDLNDTPSAPTLAPAPDSGNLGMVSGLSGAVSRSRRLRRTRCPHRRSGRIGSSRPASPRPMSCSTRCG